MNFLSIFDVIGPNMIGPSSSHTAGAVAISLSARKMFGEEITRVTFTLYGSFAKTYKGHGTDKALLGGILGFSTDDERIRDAFELAKEMGVEYTFHIDEETVTNHPKTADLLLENENGHKLFVRGESIGGGKMKIVRINHVNVEFTGEYSTLIVQQIDKPGVVAHITQCLSLHDINIAFMRLFREAKGTTAFTVVESDQPIPRDILQYIKINPNVQDLMLIEM